LSRTVRVERVIAAPASDIFELLADPAMHPVLDGSGTVRASETVGRARLGLGSELGMRMHLVVPYRLTNRVVEFEDGRLIAWTHIGGARWRYQLDPVEGGTRVVETFDLTTTTVPGLAPALQLLGFPRRNRRGMERTLARLADLVAAPS
jgi:uncharacterized protein YndB with AHSA1/START domain